MDLNALGKRLERGLDRLFVFRDAAWWWWPTLLLVSGAGTLAISWIFGPGEGERVDLWGIRFGEPCAFYVATGVPCPQCGMTRSWVWSARGYLWKGFVYNPAGATMFWWLVIAGVIGAVRLVRRDKNALAIHPDLLLNWTLAWLIAVYALPWVLRAFGFNALPPPEAPSIPLPFSIAQ